MASLSLQVLFSRHSQRVWQLTQRPLEQLANGYEATEEPELMNKRSGKTKITLTPAFKQHKPG